LREDFYNLVPDTIITVGDILFKKIEREIESSTSTTEPTSTATAAASTSSQLLKKQAGKTQTLKVPQEEDIAHEIDFTKLDIRVGEIVKVSEHPTADRLFVEDILVGGQEVRQVVSGLRQFFTADVLLGKKVLVVCNLKESKFQGIMSYGMVLAAKANDTNLVELVTPPADSLVGERVFLPGHEVIGRNPSTVWNANKIKKNKVWETASSSLLVNEEGIATYNQLPFTTSTGVCRVLTLRLMPIS
jgi:methionine--tRNA ligase beta chain